MTHSQPLTDRTLRVIESLFSRDHHEAVRNVLEQDCGTNLPFCERQDALGLERVRFAVLKLSDGDLEQLRITVEQAKVDWRDVLVGADFGYSLDAHDRWAQDLLEA
jgi:hypothetical protein